MLNVNWATSSSGHLFLKTLVTAYENSSYEIGGPPNFIKGKALGTRLPVTGAFLPPVGVRFHCSFFLRSRIRLLCGSHVAIYHF